MAFGVRPRLATTTQIGQSGAVARLTKDQAKEIARTEAGRRGWPWTEPVSVDGRLLIYSVRTNASNRGGNVSVRIRIRDGEIVAAGYADR